MKKNIVFCLLCFCCIFGVHAQNVSDTLEENGKRFIIHKVEKGQTLYGLSKFYKLTVEEIIEYNSGIENGIQTGQNLKIYVGNVKVKADPVELIHVVKQGESLYAISKKYGCKIQDLYDWNPGLTERLDVGRKIILKYKETSGTVKPQALTAEGSKAVEENKVEPVNSKDLKTLEAKTGVPVKDKVKSEFNRVEEKFYDTLRKVKGEYNVYMLIPFYAQDTVAFLDTEVETLDDYNKIKSFDFIQFYQAALLAIEDLKLEGTKMNIYIKDVNEKNGLQLKNWITSGVFADADMIIGPFFRHNFMTLLSYCQNHNILIVNPFTTNVKSEISPLFKVTSSNANQAVNLADYIRQHYTKAQLVLVNNHGSDKKKISDYKVALYSCLQDYPSIVVKEVDYSKGGISALASAINPTCENFVLAFFDGEISVTNFIQSMNRRKFDNVTLVTSSEWRKYDKIETEYFSALKTHYIDQFFVDYSEDAVISFIDRFREAYKSEPTIERFAFQGYDITLFFLNAIAHYGTDFGVEINQMELPLLSTHFHYVKTSNSTYENTFNNIYKIKNYKYVNAWADDDIAIESIKGTGEKNNRRNKR